MYKSQISEKFQTKLFKKYFCFFAFNKRQVAEQINCNFDYVSVGSGLIIPQPFVDKVLENLQSIDKKAIIAHKAAESKKDIIWSELANHEAQITGDISDTYEALDGYGYTKQDILDEYSDYFDYCCEHDYF